MEMGAAVVGSIELEEHWWAAAAVRGVAGLWKSEEQWHMAVADGRAAVAGAVQAALGWRSSGRQQQQLEKQWWQQLEEQRQIMAAVG